ncbi:hypothetical protein [Streptomyces sp. MI02-7b]|uniref:hypothetical protein n=1 Tax=Streptomyces sp. MI02-7b TaxID=462941 RepID=UPI0029A7F3C4|nr:hypothetical protein [Streptomyces sp. MI02-7b]MDX3074683.1 hypothetical protein [Streptomyces sp. MI02-7b]
MSSTRREPFRAASRPTHVLLMSLRKAVSVTLLAASLTTLSAACGRQQSATGAPPSDSTGGGPASSGIVSPTSDPKPPASPSPSVSVSPSTPRQGGIASRRVYFSSAVRAPALHTVLHDERDLSRFPGWFAASDPAVGAEIAKRAAATDFSRNVLVAWNRTTGCSAATDALLFRSGDRLVLGIDQPPPPRECFAAHQVVTVFEVPRDRMPAHPRFAQEQNPQPDPAGPGRTVAFARLDGGEPARGARNAEVTSGRQLDAFLARLSPKDARTVRGQLAARPSRPGERRFAFSLTGCRPTDAWLMISRQGVSAATTGDETIRCIQAQHWTAVLAVASSLVPERARLID